MEVIMRVTLTILVLIGAAWSGQPAQAEVDPYPWCAQQGTRDSRESCYFKTFEQCLDQIRGQGGFCNRNPRYTGPAVNGPAPQRPRR
jgi:hypothetical protein